MMKHLFFALLLVAGITTSFTTAARKKTATIVRDCTGTYLRIDGQDYFVCNKSILQDIPDNSSVEAKFKKMKKCPPTDEVVCMMYHEHKGIVKVTQVQWAKGKITHK